MNLDDFMKLRDEAVKREEVLMLVKGADYQGEEDRLGNFKQVGEILGIPPIVVLTVYADKHWRSIVKYTRTGVEGSEPIEGRIDDLVNYLHLLLGLIEEKKHARASA